MKILLLLLSLNCRIIKQPKERKLFLTSSRNAAIQKWQLRDRFDKILGKIVKDKLGDYESQNNYQSYDDANMREISDLHDESVKHILETQTNMENQLDTLYYAFVRRDPFRSYYDY